MLLPRYSRGVEFELDLREVPRALKGQPLAAQRCGKGLFHIAYSGSGRSTMIGSWRTAGEKICQDVLRGNGQRRGVDARVAADALRVGDGLVGDELDGDFPRRSSARAR